MQCYLLEPWCDVGPRTGLGMNFQDLISDLNPSQTRSPRNSLYMKVHSLAKAMTMSLRALVICVYMFPHWFVLMCFDPVLYKSSLQIVPRYPLRNFKRFEKSWDLNMLQKYIILWFIKIRFKNILPHCNTAESLLVATQFSAITVQRIKLYLYDCFRKL